MDHDEPAPTRGGLIRVRMDLAYDGTDFRGWARQPGQRTVQQVVEEAIGTALGTEPPLVTCAGRTDSGVHAVGQVAHVDLEAWSEVLPRRVSGLLPDDVALRAMSPVTGDFDARFAALDRRYSYRVCDHPSACDPSRRRTVVERHRPLDLDAMNAAAAPLLGERDFAALCRPRAGASTVRRLIDLRWGRHDSGLAVMEVTADAFCHSMVRSLVGVLLPVGDGRRPVDWPGRIVAAARRDSAVTVAPPHGLVLEEVRYPAAADLLARQRQTRVHRGELEHGAG